MTSLRRSVAALMALAALTLAAPAPCDEKPADTAAPTEAQKKEAQTLFTQGMKLAESGDARGALAAFRSAYDTLPSYRVLYNIGQLSARVGDPAGAVRAYERYLRDAGGDAPPKRVREVETELKTLTPKVAMVTVNAPEGVDVTLDDVGIGKTPLPGPVAVNPGPHTIAIARDGKSAEHAVKVAAGERPSVDLELAKDAPTPPPPEARETPAAPPPAEKRHFPVVPWVVTGGLGLVTIVTGVLTASAYSDYNATRDQFPVTKAELDDAQGSARTLFLVTGAFGALTLASAGIASYFTFVARPAAKTGATPPATRPALAVGVRPGGLGVAGVFP